jgi:hypothetical protein
MEHYTETKSVAVNLIGLADAWDEAAAGLPAQGAAAGSPLSFEALIGSPREMARRKAA